MPKKSKSPSSYEEYKLRAKEDPYTKELLIPVDGHDFSFPPEKFAQPKGWHYMVCTCECGKIIGLTKTYRYKKTFWYTLCDQCKKHKKFKNKK